MFRPNALPSEPQPYRTMSNPETAKTSKRVLEPVERISEVLFGLHDWVRIGD